MRFQIPQNFGQDSRFQIPTEFGLPDIVSCKLLNNTVADSIPVIKNYFQTWKIKQNYHIQKMQVKTGPLLVAT